MSENPASRPECIARVDRPIIRPRDALTLLAGLCLIWLILTQLGPLLHQLNHRSVGERGPLLLSGFVAGYLLYHLVRRVRLRNAFRHGSLWLDGTKLCIHGPHGITADVPLHRLLQLRIQRPSKWSCIAQRLRVVMIFPGDAIHCHATHEALHHARAIRRFSKRFGPGWALPNIFDRPLQDIVATLADKGGLRPMSGELWLRHPDDPRPILDDYRRDELPLDLEAYASLDKPPMARRCPHCLCKLPLFTNKGNEVPQPCPHCDSRLRGHSPDLVWYFAIAFMANLANDSISATLESLGISVYSKYSYWVCFIVLLFATFAFMFRFSVVAPSGVRCVTCGYDLTGCTSPCCPECGQVRKSFNPAPNQTQENPHLGTAMKEDSE